MCICSLIPRPKTTIRAKKEAFMQRYVCNTIAWWKVGRPQNSVWQYLELLHCLISVPILHFPATYAPSYSLEATEDGKLFPSNESTTSSNQGMSGVCQEYVRSICQCSIVRNWYNVVASNIWQILWDHWYCTCICITQKLVWWILNLGIFTLTS